MSYLIAVDVGGTQVRAATFAGENLTPVKMLKISTRHPYLSPVERIQEAISSVWPEDGSVASIAVAAPGPIDPYRGIVLSAPNIPGWVNLHLQQEIRNRFNVPVSLGNDANMAALGEWKFGAGQGHHHLIYMTISTGIGGGIIIDDQLLLGSRGLATEIGHVTVMMDGPRCGCGQRGHLEAVASGTALARWAEQALAEGAVSSLPSGQRLTAKQVAEAAKQGDDLARKAFSRAGTFIGIALANYLHIFNPTAVIIGGGVSRSGDLLLEPIKTALQEKVISPDYLEDLTLTTAALGDEAGLIGAFALARISASS